MKQQLADLQKIYLTRYDEHFGEMVKRVVVRIKVRLNKLGSLAVSSSYHGLFLYENCKVDSRSS